MPKVPDSWEVRIVVQVVADGELVAGRSSAIAGVTTRLPLTSPQVNAETRLEAGRMLKAAIITAATEGKIA